MKEVILQTKNISKFYGNAAAVDNVSMTIRRGDIYGLIGRNGAGKTTLTRVITSLTSATGGELKLFGESSAAGLNRARKRIGCVIEIPALYPNLSAAQNLEYYRILKGVPDRNSIEKVLGMVGLTDTGKKKFKNFSLGMKQRLGIALALLDNPDFIILDEPINGLDPMGIVEMRDTFKRLNQEHNITLMISSHILNELSLVATRYGIINKGKLMKELTNDELREECQKGISVIVDDKEKAVSIVETRCNIKKYKVVNDHEIRIYDCQEAPSEINCRLVNEGIRVSGLKEVGDNLEDYFVSLVGKEEVS